MADTKRILAETAVTSGRVSRATFRYDDLTKGADLGKQLLEVRIQQGLLNMNGWMGFVNSFSAESVVWNLHVEL